MSGVKPSCSIMEAEFFSPGSPAAHCCRAAELDLTIACGGRTFGDAHGLRLAFVREAHHAATV